MIKFKPIELKMCLQCGALKINIEENFGIYDRTTVPVRKYTICNTCRLVPRLPKPKTSKRILLSKDKGRSKLLAKKSKKTRQHLKKINLQAKFKVHYNLNLKNVYYKFSMRCSCCGKIHPKDHFTMIKPKMDAPRCDECVYRSLPINRIYLPKYKICSCCGEEKERSNEYFTKNKDKTGDSYMGPCRECSTNNQRASVNNLSDAYIVSVIRNSTGISTDKIRQNPNLIEQRREMIKIYRKLYYEKKET